MESVQTQQERDRQTRLKRRRQQERERRARETPEERDRRRSLRNQRDRERRQARCAARCASALAQLERVCTCIIIRIRIYIYTRTRSRSPPNVQHFISKKLESYLLTVGHFLRIFRACNWGEPHPQRCVVCHMHIIIPTDRIPYISFSPSPSTSRHFTGHAVQSSSSWTCSLISPLETDRGTEVSHHGLRLLLLCSVE